MDDALYPAPSQFIFDWRLINPLEWGNAIKDALVGAIQSFISKIVEYIITPLMNAIQGFVTWFWNSITTLFNSLFQSLLNFIYNWIVNPLLGLFQLVLNKIKEKMKGIIYISITIPLMVKEAKELHEVTSISEIFRKSIFFISKPIIGYLSSEILYSVISGYLKPTYIPPVTPPTPPSIPPIEEINVGLVDYTPISDSVSVLLTSQPTLFDYVAVNDIVSIQLTEARTEIGTADQVTLTDQVSVTIGEMPLIEIEESDIVDITDSISVTLSIFISIIDQVTIIDSVTVQLS